MKLETLKILQSLAKRVPRVSLCRVEDIFPALKETSINQWPLKTFKYENKLLHNHCSDRLSPETDSKVSTKELNLKCRSCKLTFNSYAKRWSHESIMHTKRFICNFCGKCFDQKCFLSQHITMHTGEKLLNCQICGKSYRFAQGLRNHMRSHSGIKPYSCATCGKLFADPTSCLMHAKKHFRHFSCEICGKSFTYKSQLKIHKYVHGTVRDFKCTICSKAYGANYLLQRHMVTHGERQYTCEVCKKKFLTKPTLRAHVTAIHSGKKHSCAICGREFSFPSNLRQHLLVHSSERPYSCTCNSKYKTRNDLRNHMTVCKFVLAVHSGKKRICRICGKELSYSSSLKRHLQVHSRELPYSCTCNLKYKFKSELRNHMAVCKFAPGIQSEHTCEICGKEFLYPCYLKRHLQVHSRELPYSCTCNTKYKSRDELRNHMAICKFVPHFDSVG